MSEVYDYRDAAGGYVFSVSVERRADGYKRVLQGVRQADGSYVWNLNGVGARPLVKAADYLALVERSTYSGDRVVPIGSASAQRAPGGGR